MERFRPKTYKFSELNIAPGERIEEYVSQQAAAYDRTAKRRPGRPARPPSRADIAKMAKLVTGWILSKNTDAEIAELLGVDEILIADYRRTL